MEVYIGRGVLYAMILVFYRKYVKLIKLTFGIEARHFILFLSRGGRGRGGGGGGGDGDSVPKRPGQGE